MNKTIFGLILAILGFIVVLSCVVYAIFTLNTILGIAVCGIILIITGKVVSDSEDT